MHKDLMAPDTHTHTSFITVGKKAGTPMVSVTLFVAGLGLAWAPGDLLANGKQARHTTPNCCVAQGRVETTTVRRCG